MNNSKPDKSMQRSTEAIKAALNRLKRLWEGGD